MRKDEIIDQFFIKYLNENFVNIAADLLDRIGFGDEYAGCTFPDEDDDFEGVQFWYFEEEVVVSDEEFLDIMCRYLVHFQKKYPRKRREVVNLINKLGLNPHGPASRR